MPSAFEFLVVVIAMIKAMLLLGGVTAGLYLVGLGGRLALAALQRARVAPPPTTRRCSGDRR